MRRGTGGSHFGPAATGGEEKESRAGSESSPGREAGRAPIKGSHRGQMLTDGLARGEPIKVIAARIGKSYQSIYREIARNCKPDGRHTVTEALRPSAES